MNSIGVRAAPIGSKEWRMAKRRELDSMPPKICMECDKEAVSDRTGLCKEHDRERYLKYHRDYGRRYRQESLQKRIKRLGLDDAASASEAAGLLGVSKRAIYRRIRNETIPATKVGKSWYIDRGYLRKYAKIFSMTRLQIESKLMELME